MNMQLTVCLPSRLLAPMVAAIAAVMLALPSPAAALAALAPTADAARCEALVRLRRQDTTIISATMIPRGTAIPHLPGASDLPSFCRVVSHVRSEPGSDIGVELWLPVEWNGIFHGNGNGGFAGLLQSGYAGMARGLRRGHAVVTTDTGTAPATPLDGDPLVGQPRKWRDWGRLSTHVMTVTGKAIAAAYYGRGAERSYYTGCSTGGQQGLIEALHYPQDYDGILVAAPVINCTWGHAAVLWNYATAHRTPESLLSEAKLRLLNDAAIARCNGSGHGQAGDAFVTDPLACRFDPAELGCKGTDNGQCLTPAEVATARAFYDGPTGKDGRPVFFGWLPGSEAPGKYGWSFLQSPLKGQPPFGSLFKWVFGADWDWRGFDLDRDMPRIDAALSDIVNDATKGSLQAFKARGGKLIIYHGLADTLVPPGQSVAFYDRQVAELGGLAQAEEAARLFMAPGLMHCGGGTGPDAFNSAAGSTPLPPVASSSHDLFSALIEWTNGGPAPEQVVATKYAASDGKAIAFQRKLCAYPRQPLHDGRGSTGSADSFTCSPRPDSSKAEGSGD
ncbi:tannase/feruloyl esterase family alpha/beta hydrolase [Niveispirillum sp. KHB5.9]|uniref:tannase/feruloyl esterase family alpha/beta hydrolase n=1 Tax=Niveispirillum sp. KHB5.9 TaxID=3400269 RepID=UPI003A855696